MKAVQVATFGATSAESAGFTLEQKPWPKKSAANFSQWLEDEGISPSGTNIFAAYEQYQSQCNGEGDLVATLRVRLHDLATPYTLRTTYGSLGPAKLVDEGRQEYLAFELDDEQEISFGKIKSCSWNGDVYNASGAKIAAPSVVISGRKAKVAENVYGVLEVTVAEQLYEYPLTISPRTPTEAQLASTDAVHDQLYAATAMLFCDNRIVLKEIEMPDNFGSCQGGRGGTEINPTEEEPTEDSGLYDVTFEAFNYCTGTIIRDGEVTLRWRETESNGAAASKSMTVAIGDTVRLRGGSYNLRATSSGYTPTDEDDLTENDELTLSQPSAR